MHSVFSPTRRSTATDALGASRRLFLPESNTGQRGMGGAFLLVSSQAAAPGSQVSDELGIDAGHHGIALTARINERMPIPELKGVGRALRCVALQLRQQISLLRVERVDFALPGLTLLRRRKVRRGADRKDHRQRYRTKKNPLRDVLHLVAFFLCWPRLSQARRPI